MNHLRKLLRRSGTSASAKRRKHALRGGLGGDRRLSSETLEKREMLAGDFALAHNYVYSADVNDDSVVSPSDALQVINFISQHGNAIEVTERGQVDRFYDVNADDVISPGDALAVINAISRAQGEEGDRLIELDVNPRDINDVALTPVAAGVSEFNVGVDEIFFLEVSYSDNRGFGATGLFNLLADLTVTKDGVASPVLEPIITETQQITFDESIQRAPSSDTLSFSLENTSDTSTPVTIAQFGQNPTGVITDALVELGFDADQVSVTRLTSGAPDFRFQVRFVDFELEGLDLPDLQVIQSSTSPIDVTHVDVPGIVPDGNGGFEPNFSAVGLNLDLNSRTFNDNEEFFNILTFGSFSPEGGFDEVGGTGPLVSGGVPAEADDGLLRNPFDAFSIPVRITQPIEDLVVQLRPGQSQDAITPYGIDQDAVFPLSEVGSDDAVFVINAIGDATGLTVQDASLSTTEDATAAVTVDLASLVTVNSGTAPTFSIQTDPSRGTAVLNGTTLQYTPSADEFGSDQIVFVATNDVESRQGTIAINIDAVNDPPVATADTASTPNDTPISIDVLANDNSGAANEADTLTVTAVGTGSLGTASVNNDGTILYTPNAGAVGQDTFTYTLSDGTDTTQGSVTVAVTASQDLIAGNGTLQTTEDNAGAVTIDLATLVTITAGGNASFEIVTANPRGSVTIVNDSILSYIPAADDFGTEVIEYRATNAAADDTGFVTVSIESVNDPPVALNDSATTEEDNAVVVAVLENDSAGPANEGQSLEVTAVGNTSNGTAVITDGGTTITFTPSPDASGTGSFTYTVSDGVTTSQADVNVTITPVNDAPSVVDDSATGAEDTTLTIDVLQNDSDVDGDSLSITSVDDGSNGTVVDNGDGTVDYTPDADFFGSDSFTYTVSDGTTTATASVVVTITNVNDAPVAVVDTAVTNEDTDVVIDVLQNDSPGPNESDSISIATLGPAVNGTAVIEAGRVRFTPAADFVGEASFTYSISDGELTSQAVSVTINVVEQNDPPEAVGDTATVAEDSSVDVDVLANDTDDLTATSSLTVDAVTQGANGAVAINADGTVRYTPAANFNGSDSFTYTVSDGVFNDTATVVVTVTAVNDAPAAGDDTASTSGDQPVIIDVLDNDIDLDGDTISVVGVQDGANGTTTLNADGTITYLPNAGFSGTDSFTYEISDGVVTAQGTVRITDELSAPIAGDATRSIVEDAATSTLIDLSTVIQADQGETPTIEITVNGQRGLATLDGTELRYTPSSDEFGSDSIVYQVSNSAGSDTGTIAISIAAVNDAPVAANDAASVIKNQSTTINLLANDSTGAANESDTLTLQQVSLPANGSVVINADNTVTYTPNTDFVGPDSFTYTVSDGDLVDTATVSITVQDFEASEISGELFIDLVDNIAEFIRSPSTVAPIRNGIKDAGESGLGGVAIRLISAASENVTNAAVDRVVMTDLNGRYVFSDVAPGSYQVIYEIPAAVVSGAGSAGVETVPFEIGSAGGVVSTGNNFVLHGLNSSEMGNIDILASNYQRANGGNGGVSARTGGVVSLDEDGNQQFFLADGGLDSAVFGEIALNDDRDAALLSLIEDDGTVKVARLSSDDFVVSRDGRSVRFFGGESDYDFFESNDDLLAAEFANHRNAIDLALANFG